MSPCSEYAEAGQPNESNAAEYSGSQPRPLRGRWQRHGLADGIRARYGGHELDALQAVAFTTRDQHVLCQWLHAGRREIEIVFTGIELDCFTVDARREHTFSERNTNVAQI